MRERMRRAASGRATQIAGLIVLLAIAAGAGALLGGGGEETRSVPEAGGRDRSERRASFLAKLIPPAPEGGRRSSRAPRSVAGLARRLPLERKVAQVFLLGFTGQDLQGPIFRRFRRLDLGGMVISNANYRDPQQLALLAGEAAVIAQQERHVPPWVLAAQEGGEFNEFPDLPPPTAASDLPSASVAAREAAQAGTALRPLGVNGLLGPVVDVGLAEDPAVGPRAFSDEVPQVSRYARAVIRAYRRTRMFTVAKHFPGLGSASQSTEEGPANVGLSLAELRRRDLVPFRAAIAAGVPGILVSHGLYAADDFVTPGSLSKRISTDLLRKELRFRGIAVADDLADPPITALGSVPDAAVQALKAGADMLYISGSPGDQQAAYVAVLRAVRSGEVKRGRLDEAVRRILYVKRDYGLLR